MLTSTSLKRHVPRCSISFETSAANLLVFLTFVLQFILGSSYQREENLPVYFHFNHRFQNSRIGLLSSVCIGPFRSDVSGNCVFDHHVGLDRMDCFKCYPHGCYRKSNFMDITANLVAQKNGPTEENKNLKRFLNTSGTLFVDLERQCNWLKRTSFLEWYVNWCEDFRWPNNENSQCPADTTTPTTTTVPTPITSTTTTSSTKLPIISFTNFSHSTFPSITNWTPTSPQYRQKINSATSFGEQKPNTPAVMATKTSMRNRFLWTTTSSTIPINSSSNFSPSTTSLPITHQQNNSTTDIGVHSSNKSNFDNKILWISLGVIAIFCTLTVFVILFCQRAKIAKFLRRSENPDVLDDAFYYTDVSMGRRENRSDSVTYKNVIPNLLHNEPITYVELDFNVQKNSNPENAAAEINSTTLNQKRDIKGYVDSVIYAELRK